MKIFDKLILFIYVDALDFNKLNVLTRENSFLKIADAIKQLENIPGYSFGIQATLLTGKLPQEHKHWMPYIHLERENVERIRNIFMPLKYLFPLKLRFENRVIEFLSSQSNNALHYAVTGKKALLSSSPLEWYERIYVYPYYYMNELPFFKKLVRKIEERNYQVCYIGHNLNRCVKGLTDAILNFHKKNHKQIMLFLYIDDLDGIGHKYGISSSEYLRTLLSVNAFLSWVFRICKNIARDFALLIFSDHSMCNTADKINLVRILKSITNCIEFAVIDATMAFIWLKNELQSDNVVAILESELRDQALILTPMLDKHELKKHGIYFGNREYGDIIIQLKPCKTFYPNSYSSLWWLKALHGFWPNEEVQKCSLAMYSPSTYDDILYNIRSVSEIHNMLIRLIR